MSCWNRRWQLRRASGPRAGMAALWAAEHSPADGRSQEAWPAATTPGHPRQGTGGPQGGEGVGQEQSVPWVGTAGQAQLGGRAPAQPWGPRLWVASGFRDTGIHLPTAWTSQVRASVSHGDGHSGGCGLLEAGLGRVDTPGHDPLGDTDHDLWRARQLVKSRPLAIHAGPPVTPPEPAACGHLAPGDNRTKACPPGQHSVHSVRWTS